MAWWAAHSGRRLSRASIDCFWWIQITVIASVCCFGHFHHLDALWIGIGIVQDWPIGKFISLLRFSFIIVNKVFQIGMDERLTRLKWRSDWTKFMAIVSWTLIGIGFIGFMTFFLIMTTQPFVDKTPFVIGSVLSFVAMGAGLIVRSDKLPHREDQFTVSRHQGCYEFITNSLSIQRSRMVFMMPRLPCSSHGQH